MRINFTENNLFLENDYRVSELSDNTKRLFEHQINNWKLASNGYESLKSIQKKTFEFDGFNLEAHYNPGRIISSSAKVDNKSIEERPCFLCVKNLPLEQKAIKAIGNYIILVNPFPIFPVHFTIPSINHEPQLIINEFQNLLLLTKELGKDYSLFYNGPKCGASAPDHLHFQAGSKNFMRIDDEYESVIKKYGSIVCEENDAVLYKVTGYLRNYFSIESNNVKSIIDKFNVIYNLLFEKDDNDEPMMNIICTYEKSWRVIIFPRSKHRPNYFFEEGDNKILISPAAVDFGGVCIFPREEDFNKITKELLVDVFKQVTISEDKINYIAKEIQDL